MLKKLIKTLMFSLLSFSLVLKAPKAQISEEERAAVVAEKLDQLFQLQWQIVFAKADLKGLTGQTARRQAARISALKSELFGLVAELTSEFVVSDDQLNDVRNKAIRLATQKINVWQRQQAIEEAEREARMVAEVREAREEAARGAQQSSDYYRVAVVY